MPVVLNLIQHILSYYFAQFCFSNYFILYCGILKNADNENPSFDYKDSYVFSGCFCSMWLIALLNLPLQLQYMCCVVRYTVWPPGAGFLVSVFLTSRLVWNIMMFIFFRFTSTGQFWQKFTLSVSFSSSL